LIGANIVFEKAWEIPVKNDLPTSRCGGWGLIQLGADGPWIRLTASQRVYITGTIALLPRQVAAC